MATYLFPQETLTVLQAELGKVSDMQNTSLRFSKHVMAARIFEGQEVEQFCKTQPNPVILCVEDDEMFERTVPELSLIHI